MGLTCAALHMFSPALSGAAAQSLAHLAATAVAPLGYDPVSNPDEADLHLVAVAAEPWVTLFDRANPGGVTEDSVDLGKRFSAAAQGPVLLTTVYDSDMFGFILFDKGKQVDGYASGRGLLPGRIKKWSAEQRTQEWSRLFGRTIALADVQALTEKGMLFADDLLMRLCDLLGVSRELATTTPRDLQSRPLPNQQEFYFRSRPEVAGGLPVKQTVAHKAQTAPLQLALRSEHSIAFELNGPAGVFTDPVLEFSGPAVNAGLVVLSDKDFGCYGLWALGMEAIRAGDIRRGHAVLSSAEKDGQQVLRTCLQGFSAAQFSFPPRKQSILIYWICLRAVAVGSGDLHVRLRPDGSKDEHLSLRPVFHVTIGARPAERLNPVSP